MTFEEWWSESPEKSFPVAEGEDAWNLNHCIKAAARAAWEAALSRSQEPEACREIVNKSDHMEGFVGYRCNQPKGHEGEHALRWFILGKG